MSTIDLGRIRMDWKGEFDPTIPQIFTKGDVLKYQGDVYTVISDDSDPLVSTDGWDATKVELMINGQLPTYAEGSLATFDNANQMTELAVDTTAGKSLITDGTTVKWSKNSIKNGKNLINYVEYPYTAGVWNASTSEAWVPGLYVDYTPISSTSKIKLHLEFSCSFNGGNGHIGHFRSYVGTDAGAGSGAAGNYAFKSYISISGQTSEERVSMEIPCASWGAGVEGRIGLYGRGYSGSWMPRFHASYYWNGAQGQKYCEPIVYIEEWEEEA